MSISQALKGAFMLDFAGAFGLAMKKFFQPKLTINYPFENAMISGFGLLAFGLFAMLIGRTFNYLENRSDSKGRSK